MMRHTLEDDLMAHERFKARLKDRQFALDAYHFLRNPIIHEDGSRHSLSQRSIGEVIADLRGENEDYIDYYLSDIGLTAVELEAAGENDADLAVLLSEIGWMVMTVEQEIALYEEALERLSVAEQREVGSTPDWFSERFGSDYAPTKDSGQTPYGRLRHLSFTGKIDVGEVDFIAAHIFLSEQASSRLGHYVP